MSDLGDMVYGGIPGVHVWAGLRSPAEYQEYLLEVCDFVAPDGDVVDGVCLVVDGECNGMDGYCGGCGGCMIMQAVHARYRLIYGWRLTRATHALAWDDALRDVGAWCEEQESLAGETLLMADPGLAKRLPRFWDNAAAKAALGLGGTYIDVLRGLPRVVW